jgi:predicted helicase
MTPSDPVPAAGTFEYIEAKIRREANGTSFGGDFEWLCRWFLENAPRYRGQFDKAWLWKDWPDRWGTDAGIDLVARTRTGELWAIQAKADHPDRAIPKREIDSFLSESNRSQFAYSAAADSWRRRMTLGPRLAGRFMAKRSPLVWSCVVIS